MRWFHLSRALTAGTSNLQVPVRYFESSFSKIMQINCGTAVGGYWNQVSNDILHLWNERVTGFCCKYHAPIHGVTSHERVIRIWQGMLPLCLRIGGFALLASFRCSTCGPSTTYVGIKASSVLQTFLWLWSCLPSGGPFRAQEVRHKKNMAVFTN